ERHPADALRGRRRRRDQEAEEGEVTRGDFEVESAATREGLPVETAAGPLLAEARIPLERSLRPRSVRPRKKTDREASGGPARPAALVGLASTHAGRLNRPSRNRTCFDKRCRRCRPAGGLLVGFLLARQLQPVLRRQVVLDLLPLVVRQDAAIDEHLGDVAEPRLVVHRAAAADVELVEARAVVDLLVLLRRRAVDTYVQHLLRLVVAVDSRVLRIRGAAEDADGVRAVAEACLI